MTIEDALRYVRGAPYSTERELLMADEILRLRATCEQTAKVRDRAVAHIRLLETRFAMIGDALNYRTDR